MATYYPSLSNQRDVMPASYLWDQKAAPSPEPSHLHDSAMHISQASAASYTDLLSGSSLSVHEFSQVSSVGARDEMEFIPPTGDLVNLEPNHSQLNITTSVSVDNAVNVVDGEGNLTCQGLSLSLGTRLPSSFDVSSFQCQYTEPGTSRSLSTHIQTEDGSQSKESRNAEYFSYSLPGATPNMAKAGALNNPYYSMSTGEMNSSSHPYEPSVHLSLVYNSKYLKAAQQLLDEVVNVRKALEKYETGKNSNYMKSGLSGSVERDVDKQGNPFDANESTANCSSELSISEQENLQNKSTKLLSMLDELDRRYRQYYHQMQIVVSSFEMVAGHGAAKPYTALALKTISRHFRCLRDAINNQIREIRKRLGGDTTSAGQGGLPRLRYVDQQLRQQRSLEQFGLMPHSWRPQRGLPESSVTILRAWLFEHFLHPYPKDSEKIMLARQTGLSRSQVANWFINARVRLWKPMIEDIYKEEFGEIDSKSSPEPESKAARDNKPSPSRDIPEELPESMTTGATEELGQFDDTKSDLVTDVGMQGCTTRLGFQSRNNISELGTLGLQRGELNPLSVSGAMQFRGDYAEASLMSHGLPDYHYLDQLHQQHTVPDSNLLPDLVE
ncbi:BEL1-like homeodomain protein 7 [Diospyros lotus]|uniref:BEL1-like homeodomain protein 7 n=1 Tax=Diospyros lotus TaxID=55363 RepID=UPI002256DFEE|nr:BEL1-like homeodomain protein 7 [Diospyros lotus]XP_052203531.1 BEL1-like homeodomain protein 7 [Diospyros lotus]XP_052203532.1 BEL1-like homeodomain protein 7 [Diospyros lotus]